MSLRRRLANWIAPTETRWNSSWRYLDRSGGGAIEAREAEGLATVSACISVISSAIASLPAFIYHAQRDGRAVDDAHAVARLINEGWSPYVSWSEGLEFLIAEALLHGNGLAEIERDSSGAATGLRPIPWRNVSVQLLAGGRLAYDVLDLHGALDGSSRTRRLLDDDVLHLRDRTDDGLIGRSRLSRSHRTFRNSDALERMQKSMFENMARPSGVLSTDNALNAEARENLKLMMQARHQGVDNFNQVFLAEGGLKWTSITPTSVDNEMLAHKRFDAEEIARVFGVPPPLVGIWDNSTFTNAETAGRWFAQHTLQPWLMKVEQAFKRQVFSQSTRLTHHLEIDVSGFLRGAPTERWRAWAIVLSKGVLTADEIREVEGWGPRADGAERPQPDA